MIGLSLPRCILDIVEKRVSLHDVEKIYSDTGCCDEADWQRTLEKYCRTVWKGLSEEALVVYLNLRLTGRIIQPRLRCQTHFPDSRKRIWADDESQIRWIDD